MKRIMIFSITVLMSMSTTTWAGGLCLGCKEHCTVPPEPSCPDCTCPCDKCRLPSLYGCEHVKCLIEGLHGDTCCDRISAARKLGHRLHADFCANPEVLSALINALQCDPCFEVREAAAWSIMKQNAHTEQGVLALYISSKLDPHNLVRARAAEALDILLVGGKKACFKGVFESGDELIKSLKKSGYKPGTENCQIIFAAQADSMNPPVKKVEAGSKAASPAALELQPASPLPSAPKTEKDVN